MDALRANFEPYRRGIEQRDAFIQDIIRQMETKDRAIQAERAKNQQCQDALALLSEQVRVFRSRVMQHDPDIARQYRPFQQ